MEYNVRHLMKQDREPPPPAPALAMTFPIPRMVDNHIWVFLPLAPPPNSVNISLCCFVFMCLCVLCVYVHVFMCLCVYVFKCLCLCVYMFICLQGRIQGGAVGHSPPLNLKFFVPIFRIFKYNSMLKGKKPIVQNRKNICLNKL